MAVMGYADLLAEDAAPGSESARYAAEVQRECERIATIVRNLLGFARQDKRPNSPERVVDVVGAALSSIRTVLRHDRIRLELQLPDDLPRVSCRSQQIQQVLMNLVTNARDALNERYPDADDDKKIRISANVPATANDGGRRLRLTVEDHGPGIPAAIRDAVFDPFFTTKPSGKGTGMGLSISHDIVRDHGGQLSLETEPGRWTRFHVDLPVASDA